MRGCYSEVEEDPSIGISMEKVGLTPWPKIQQVLKASVMAVPTSLSSIGEAKPPLKKVRTKGRLPPSDRYALWDVACLLCNLSILMSELEIRWYMGRKRTLGTLNFRWSVP
jgi:hypothetical protein